MTEPTGKELTEFWERCGVKGRWVEDGRRQKFPRIDLTNLFRHGVQTLPEVYQDVRLFSFVDDLNDGKVFWFAHITANDTGDVEFASIRGEETPELALFWVLNEAGMNEGVQTHRLNKAT